MEEKMYFRWTTLVVFVIFTLVGFSMWGCPKYNVWQQGLAGQAELKRAEQNRQIAIQEAMAVEESAKSLANAEIIRAVGVDSANKIISSGLKGNWEYLHYLWVNTLKDHPGAIIYIPTEANIPIMEASRNMVNTPIDNTSMSE
jgi:hypothetical protein